MRTLATSRWLMASAAQIASAAVACLQVRTVPVQTQAISLSELQVRG